MNREAGKSEKRRGQGDKMSKISSSRLSDTEKAQLGQKKVLQNGTLSDYAYADKREWGVLREYFLKMSRSAAARYKPGFVLPDRLTGYTPGETLGLLEEPEVKGWHKRMRSFSIPEKDELGREYKMVVFVPCAKSKPWDTQKVGLYGSYNEIREKVKSGELPPVYFVTISEPLGVVPEEHWGDFPMYDNPGLFKNESLRASGLMTSDFAKIKGLSGKVIVPFDEVAYKESIERLGKVIGAFIKHNKAIYPDIKWASFVDGFESVPSTHSDMLDVATDGLDVLPKERRFTKKVAPRTRPVEHLAGHIREMAGSQVARAGGGRARR